MVCFNATFLPYRSKDERQRGGRIKAVGRWFESGAGCGSLNGSSVVCLDSQRVPQYVDRVMKTFQLIVFCVVACLFSVLIPPRRRTIQTWHKQVYQIYSL